MKSYLRKYIWLAIPLGIALIFFSTCNFKNPTDNLKLIVNFESVKTTVAVDFVNSKTGATIDDRTITLQVEGKDRAMAVDLTNEPASRFSVTEGLISFGIREGVTPTPDSPLELRLIVNAAGYLPTSLPVVIDSTGSHPFSVFMVLKSDPPEGVSTTSDNSGQAGNNGAVLGAIVVSTDPEPESGCAATVTIPQGTIVTDGSGNPLQGGLTVEVTYFNSQTESSLNSFPGGFSVNVSADPDGNPGEGVFITAGFIVVEITDANGRKASSFDPEITLTIEIAPGTINPETDLPVAAGDIIPVWSYDNATGEWQYEGPGVVTGPNANGNFQISYQTGHLSWWNLDWWWWWCSLGKRIVLQGKTDCDGCLWVNVKAVWGGWTSWRYICDDFIQFYYIVPKSLPVEITAFDRWGRRVGGPLRIEDLCDLTQPVMNINIQSTNTYRVFHITGTCPNKDRLDIRPSLPVWIREAGTSRWRYLGYVRNGVLEICNFEVPKRYEIKTFYRGRYYSALFDFYADYSVFVSGNYVTATASGNHVYYNVTLPDNLCNRL
ncbi:MAG TPA: hypothetical protein ENN17_02340 [bacterium]|nr:hypothetical protein [bacterium]